MRIGRKLKKCLRKDNGFMGTLLTSDKTGLPYSIMCILRDYDIRVKANKPRFYIILDNNTYVESYKQSNLLLCLFSKHGVKPLGKVDETLRLQLDKFVFLNYNILMDYWYYRGDSSILYKGVKNIG